MSLDFQENNSQDNFRKYYSSNFVEGDTESEPIETKGEQPSNDSNLYNSKGDKTKLSKKIFNKIKKNKAIAISGGGLGAGTLLLIILLFIGAQQLPGFAALIADVDMAKDNQLFERDTTELTSEKAALEAESPADKATLESDDSSAGDTLTQLEAYNPNEAFDNLEAGNDISFNYANDGRLNNVDINGTDVPENDISPNKWLDTDDMSDSLASSSSGTSVPDLMNEIGSLDENGGILIREGSAAQDIEALQGDALGGIDNSSQFENDSADESDVLLDEDAQTAIDPSALSATNLSQTSLLKSTETDAIQTESEDATNQTAIEKTISDGGVDPAVETTIDNDIEAGLGGVEEKILTTADPLYLIGVPLCIIYDGSLGDVQNASTTTDNQDNEVESTYVFTESAADQEKSGNLSAQAIAAINRKFSNLDESNAEIDQSGGSADTLSGIVSPQSGAGANYSTQLIGLADVLGTNGFCGLLTNKLLAGGIITVLTATQIGDLLSVSTTIVDGAVDEAVDATVDNGVNAITSSVAKGAASVSAAQYISENGLGDYLSAISEKVSNYIEGTGAEGTDGTLRTAMAAGEKKIIKAGGTITGVAGVTYGLTLLAHEAVKQNLGTTYNGYSQGTSFADQADEGGNTLSNQLVQQQYYGVPLSPAQVTYNKATDVAYLSSQNSSKSAYQRYFALSNPFSLLSRVTTTTYADITNFSLSSFFEKIASVFNPDRLITGLFSLFSGSRIYASSSSPTYDTTDYGITQWGYTSQENALTNPKTGDPSYQPLQNAEILNTQNVTSTDGTVEAASEYIQNTYGMCFTDSMGELLDTSPGSGPGAGTPYITRDPYGNVVDTPNSVVAGKTYQPGRCSEYYLGPNSADSNLKDTAKNQKGASFGNDLGFRWRLNQSYLQSLDMLINIQNGNS